MKSVKLISHLHRGCSRIGFLSVLVMLFMGLSLPAQATEALRISTEQLHQSLNQPGLVILDSRTPEAYLAGHLPGALNFPELWTYQDKAHDGRIVQPMRIQSILQSLGIKTTTPVVIYDSGEMYSAARLFWTLEVYGLTHVQLLNQGYANWIGEHYPLTKDQPTPKTSDYVPVINPERLATKLTTLIASKSNQQLIIDARPNTAYRGLESSAKRFGHIPTAINIPASHNLEQTHQTTHLKSLETLKALYGEAPKSKKIILYCAIGRISTMNYFTLRELGYNVANYDASWQEWGNDFNLPIEK